MGSSGADVPSSARPADLKPFSSRRESVYNSVRGFVFVVAGRGALPRAQIKSVEKIMAEIDSTISGMDEGGAHNSETKMADQAHSGDNATTQSDGVQHTGQSPIVQPAPSLPISATDDGRIEYSESIATSSSTTLETKEKKETKDDGSLTSVKDLRDTWSSHYLTYRRCKAQLFLTTNRELGSTDSGRQLISDISVLHSDVQRLQIFAYKTTVRLTTPTDGQPKPSLFPSREAPA